MITDTSIKGYTVDTFKETVLLEDTDFDNTVLLSVDEALTLANRLIRAANKAAQHLR